MLESRRLELQAQMDAAVASGDTARIDALRRTIDRETLECTAHTAEHWQTIATNNAARVERVTDALDERRAEYVEKRDAAVLPTAKAIYQAFIDAIDRIKEKLNAGGN